MAISQRMRSSDYENSLVICHLITRKSDRWLICKFTLSGHCSFESYSKRFHNESGTSYLRSHTNTHKVVPNCIASEKHTKASFAQKLRVIEAAAIPVRDDLLPLSFAHQKLGIIKVATALIAICQIVLATALIHNHDLLPTPKAVRYSINHLRQTDRDHFRQIQLMGMLDVGVGVTTDGLKQTPSGTKSYEFIVRYIDLRELHPVTKHRYFCMRSKVVFTINHSGL